MIGRNEVVRVGPHVFGAIDVCSAEAEPFIRSYGPPALIYTDLPYNEGTYKMFATRRGELDPPPYATFLEDALYLCSRCTGDVFLEIGRPMIGRLCVLIEEAEGQVLDVWPGSYSNGEGKMAVVRCFWQGDVQLNDYPEPPKIPDSTWMPNWVIREFSAADHIVTDLCTGFGTTARYAMQNGRRFVGMEVYAQRIERAVQDAERYVKMEREHAETLEVL